MIRVLAVLFVVGAASHAEGQPAQRVVGTSVGAMFQYDAKAATTTEKITLSFAPTDGRAFTVDFAFRYDGRQMTTAPAVVDQTITRYSPDEAHPYLALEIGGATSAPPARLTSRTTVTTTMPFADFIQLTRAASVRERIFNTELEFSPGQMRMLRSVVDRTSRALR